MSTQLPIENIIRHAGEGAIDRLVSELADIAIVVDSGGIVMDVPHIGDPAERLEPEAWRGRPFADTVVAASRPVAGNLVDRVLGGRAGSGEVILHPGPSNDHLAIRYGGTPIAGGEAILLLGQASRAPVASPAFDFGAVFSAGIPTVSADPTRGDLGDVLRHGADLVVLIDERGRLLWANDAFLAAAEISRVSGVEGRFLEDIVTWRDSADVDTLVALAAASGASGPVPARIQGDAGAQIEVSIGITRLPRTVPPVYGAVIRALAGSAVTGTSGQAMLAVDVEDMLDRAGQVPLKGLVRETAEMVERHCLQAALRLTGNNRSAAARSLGISRQALYQKLERFGLIDD